MAPSPQGDFPSTLNISFEDNDFSDSDRRPTDHDDLFRDIVKLGQTVYEKYCVDVTVELREKPWRKEIHRRANRVSHIAKRCFDGKNNEMEWRLKLEPEVMARFDFEVTCKSCRKRLWMSEIDSWIGDETPSLTKIASQRGNRGVCECGRGARGEDTLEAGLSLVFESHASEFIIHEGPGGLKPDRVYGLKRTKRFQRILDSIPSIRGPSIGKIVESSPFRKNSEQVLFPFLVLEAKSEKSADSFSKIESQTKSVICALLKLQNDLKMAAAESETSQWNTGPFAWFLSYRGEHWHVAAAFIDEIDGIPAYRVANLWDGRITRNETALQLLLIIDYIFDWARDVYRTIITDELLALAETVTPSLLDDAERETVAYDSTPYNHQLDLYFEGHEEPIQHEQYGTAELLRFLETEKRDVIRDARMMQHKLRGLEITADNIEEFMQSIGQWRDHVEARNLERGLDYRFAWRVKSETFEAVELLWTGQNSDHFGIRPPDQIFVVSFAISSCLSDPFAGDSYDAWNQSHTLSFIALAEDAVEILREKASLQRRWLLAPEKCPFVSKEFILRFLGMIRSASVPQCFEAARISTTMITSSIPCKRQDTGDFSIQNPATGKTKWFKAVLRHPESVDVAEGPSRVYQKLKIGRREPSESFLRASCHEGFHNPGPECLLDWPRSKLDIPLNELALFVYDSGPRPRPYKYVRCCIYWMGLTLPCKSETSLPAKELRSPSHRTLVKRIRKKYIPVSLGQKKQKLTYFVAAWSDFAKLLDQMKANYLDLQDKMQSLPQNEEEFVPYDWFHFRHEFLKRRFRWQLSERETCKFLVEEGKSYGLEAMLRDMRSALDRAIECEEIEKSIASGAESKIAEAVAQKNGDTPDIQSSDERQKDKAPQLTGYPSEVIEISDDEGQPLKSPGSMISNIAEDHSSGASTALKRRFEFETDSEERSERSEPSSSSAGVKKRRTSESEVAGGGHGECSKGEG